ncbi:NUDIX domain-containing protein [Streptomyces griseus]|uniref:NUDIX domain-containing protein n=1 Tax=Streptomyces griseus TaxID=1911 RepID=UPI0037A71004
MTSPETTETDLVGALLTAERAAPTAPLLGHSFGAQVLVRDPRNRILMVKPVTQDIWLLPGSLGGIRDGESVSDAAERELLKDTGVVRTVTHVLSVDQVPSVPRAPLDRFIWVCDGGVVTVDEAHEARLPESAKPVLEGLSWIELGELRNYTSAPQLKCINEAMVSVDFGLGVPLLEFGERVETWKPAAA